MNKNQNTSTNKSKPTGYEQKPQHQDQLQQETLHVKQTHEQSVRYKHSEQSLWSVHQQQQRGPHEHSLQYKRKEQQLQQQQHRLCANPIFGSEQKTLSVQNNV